MWIFDNLDYCNIDYFFRHVKTTKSFGWMWGGPMTLMGNFI
jgi:hypothetical protein